MNSFRLEIQKKKKNNQEIFYPYIFFYYIILYYGTFRSPFHYILGWRPK